MSFNSGLAVYLVVESRLVGWVHLENWVARIDAAPQPSPLYLRYHEFATRILSAPDTLQIADHVFSLSKDFAFVIMPIHSSSCFLNSSHSFHIIFRSGRTVTTLPTFHSEGLSLRNLTESFYLAVKGMVLYLNGSNMLTLPHLSTAFPTAYNLSNHTPLILLFTDSQLEPDPQYDTDVYMFKSLQLEYSMCENANESDSPIPKLVEQQESLYRRLHEGKSEQCRRASICPIWWRKAFALSNQTQVDAWLTCGLHKSSIPLSSNHSVLSFSKTVLSSLDGHPARKDIISLAAHLLNYDLNPYDDVSQYEGIEDIFVVRSLNRRCCEFAIREATHRSGIFNTQGVRAYALDLIRGKANPEYNRLCQSSYPINYAKFKMDVANITAMGCHRWGNGSLTFFTVSSHNSPHWVRDLFGEDKSQLPRVAIVDARYDVIYSMKIDLSYDNIAKFIAQFHNDTLDRILISNSKPTVREEADNFREAYSAQELHNLIEQESRDVVVLFYGRYCGYTTHGRGALYEFQSVARHFARRSSPLFVVVDVDMIQLPWSLTVEYVPAVIFFPSKRKSNSMVFPQVLLASTDLFSNLVAFVNKHAEASNASADSAKSDSYRMAEHLRVHLSQIAKSENLLENLLERLSTGLEELNTVLHTHALRYTTYTTSGRLVLERLLFSRDKLSSLWSHFKRVQEQLLEERKATMAVKAHLLANDL
nr:thioredoxin domain containing protein 11 [Hymenolepis microstoma]